MINPVLHYCVKEEKYDYLLIINSAYKILIEENEMYMDWFLFENSVGMNILDLAAQRANKDIIKYIYSIIKNQRGLNLFMNRNNVFHYAAKRNECFPIVSFLIKIFFYEKYQGDNLINETNQYGITPLHYACYFGNRRAIDLLLDLKADLNKRDNDGNTPLHYAVNSNCQRTIKKLIIRGASKKIKNNDGKTPYDLARDTNHTAVADLLDIKSLYKKYICMENELTQFKKTRNDRLLYFVIIFVLVFKSIYIIKYSTNEDKPLYCTC
jgi:hypothetical protein